VRRFQGFVSASLRKRWWLGLLTGLVALLGLLYLRSAFLGGINNDEVEHAHVGFRILMGQLPYRDFLQNHWPAYWLLSTQLVRAFPFSVNAILAGRAVSLLALAGSWLLGFRLLTQIRGGRTRLAILIYTFAVIVAAHQTQFQFARPDPLMTLLGTAGLCLIPARGQIRGGRALLLGLLFGLSASVSTRVAPFVLVVPTVMLLRAMHDRKPWPVSKLTSYGVGMLVGLLPTAVWLFHGGLFDSFYFDVFRLNAALSKPWYESFSFLNVPIFLGALMGTLAWLSAYRRPSGRNAHGPLVLGLALAAGIVLAFITRHKEPYHFQLLVIPWAIGFASLVVFLWPRTRSLTARLLLTAALIGYPAAHTTARLVLLGEDSISQTDLQQLIDLARPGERTCMAFAPPHPIFCSDVSEVDEGWDIMMAERIRDARQLERYRRIWRDAIRNTLDQQPHIIVRRSRWNVWERAVAAGLVTPEELALLDELGRSYDVESIGGREVWVRRNDN